MAAGAGGQLVVRLVALEELVKAGKAVAVAVGVAVGAVALWVLLKARRLKTTIPVVLLLAGALAADEPARWRVTEWPHKEGPSVLLLTGESSPTLGVVCRKNAHMIGLSLADSEGQVFRVLPTPYGRLTQLEVRLDHRASLKTQLTLLPGDAVGGIDPLFGPTLAEILAAESLWVRYETVEGPGEVTFDLRGLRDHAPLLWKYCGVPPPALPN